MPPSIEQFSWIPFTYIRHSIKILFLEIYLIVIFYRCWRYSGYYRMEERLAYETKKKLINFKPFFFSSKRLNLF